MGPFNSIVILIIVRGWCASKCWGMGGSLVQWLLLMFYITCLYDLMRSFETTQMFKFEHTQMFNLLVEKPRPHFTHLHAHFVNAYFVNALDTFVLL